MRLILNRVDHWNDLHCSSMLLVYFFTCMVVVKAGNKLELYTPSTAPPYALLARLDERDYGGYEAKLHRDLLGSRTPNDKSTRPSLHSNQTTHLEFGISLINVLEMDPLTHTLSTCVWCRMVWYDYGFHWNSDDYGGINVLRLLPDTMWMPDVLLLNAVESSKSDVAQLKSNVLVYPEGQVLWVPSNTYRTSCAIDLYRFPFDTQVCSWVFRAWSNEGKDLRFDRYNDKINVDLSDYWMNSEWEVEHEDPKVYSTKSISYAIRLRRRSHFFVLTILVPILFSWLLTFILFCVPSSSNRRIFLSSLNIFYLQLLTIYLQWMLPSNGNYAPRIVTLCGQSTIFAALFVLFSVVLVAMDKCESPPRLSSCFKNALIGWFGKILILDRHRIRGASLGARLLTSSNVELNVNLCDKNVYDEIHEDWKLLIIALNRLVFILYCAAFIGIVIATWLSF